MPLAIDHFGHIGVEDCIKLGRRIEKFNLAWMEDMIPWQYTEQYVRLAHAVTTPICTGEDIYLKENFQPLLEAGGVSVIHPDVLTTGGILETKKIGDMAQDYGVAMAIHMAESPIACLAAAHVAAATENFLALEYHSCEVDWWDDIVIGAKLPKPLVQNGFITMTDAPGLGIEDLNDEVLAQHLHPDMPELWAPTEQWNKHYSNDRPGAEPASAGNSGAARKPLRSRTEGVFAVGVSIDPPGLRPCGQSHQHAHNKKPSLQPTTLTEGTAPLRYPAAAASINPLIYPTPYSLPSSS